MIVSSYDSLPEPEKKSLEEQEEKISAIKLGPEDLVKLAQKEAESKAFYQGIRIAERRKQTLYCNQLIGGRQK